MIEREKKITIGERTFIAKFPNVGKMIDMETLKQALTGNRYSALATSTIKSMYFALDLVDAIVFYSICMKEVGKYFNVQNYTEMQIDEINLLLKVYQDQVKPWYEETLKQLNDASIESGK